MHVRVLGGCTSACISGSFFFRFSGLLYVFAFLSFLRTWCACGITFFSLCMLVVVDDYDMSAFLHYTVCVEIVLQGSFCDKASLLSCYKYQEYIRISFLCKEGMGEKDKYKRMSNSMCIVVCMCLLSRRGKQVPTRVQQRSGALPEQQGGLKKRCLRWLERQVVQLCQ